MVHLYRLICAVLLLCVSSAAMADGGPFPATPGQFSTANCNPTNNPKPFFFFDDPGAWTCQATADPNIQQCGWAYTLSNSPMYVACTQQKGPDTCPAGATLGTGGDGSSTCTCSAGLLPFNGQCVAAPSCPAGTHEQGGACVPNDCNPDETRINGLCVKDPPCPAGQSRVNGVCKKNGCEPGKSVGERITDGDTTTYSCEGGCTVRTNPSVCVKFGDVQECVGTGRLTGAKCTPGDGGGSNPGTGGDDNGGGTGDGGTGGTGTGGTGTGGTGTGGTGTGGTGTGGTGTGGTGTGGTGTGGTGTGGTGTGGTGTGDGGTGTGGTGTGGTGTGGTGSGTGGQTFPPVIPIPPAPDGQCPSGTHKVGEICIKNPESPDGDGKCPEGSIKINGKCVYSEPPTGGGTGTGGGGTGSGDGDGDGDKSGFGGSCMAGFACEGDAIQCAIAREQYARNCKLFDDTSPESDLYNANKGKTGNQTGDLPGNETISLSGRIDTSDPLGGGGCFGDLSVTVWGTSVSLPLSSLCQYLAMLGNILVAVSMLMAARIVTRG